MVYIELNTPHPKRDGRGPRLHNSNRTARQNPPSVSAGPHETTGNIRTASRPIFPYRHATPHRCPKETNRKRGRENANKELRPILARSSEKAVRDLGKNHLRSERGIRKFPLRGVDQ